MLARPKAQFIYIVSRFELWIESCTSEQERRNEALAIRYHDEIFQKGKLEVADEILSPDFVIRNPVLPEDLRKGPEGTKKYASVVITAVPDRKLVQHDILSKGDKVLIRWTNSGTQTGPLFGNPPMGKTHVATGFGQGKMVS